MIRCHGVDGECRAAMAMAVRVGWVCGWRRRVVLWLCREISSEFCLLMADT